MTSAKCGSTLVRNKSACSNRLFSSSICKCSTSSNRMWRKRSACCEHQYNISTSRPTSFLSLARLSSSIALNSERDICMTFSNSVSDRYCSFCRSLRSSLLQSSLVGCTYCSGLFDLCLTRPEIVSSDSSSDFAAFFAIAFFVVFFAAFVAATLSAAAVCF